MLNYSNLNYSTEIEKFLFSKFTTVDELICALKNDTCLFSDSIESFLFKTGFVTDRFHESYALAVRITLQTLQKPHLSGVCRFKKLPIDRAIKWLRSRIVNNIKNVLTDKNSSFFMGEACDFDENHHYSTNEAESEAELEAELGKMSKEKIEKGLVALWKNGENIDEIRYLADKFAVDIDFLGEVVIQNNNAQLTFDFGV